MPKYTIERTYLMPVYIHATYEADSLEQACRLAVEDNGWDGCEHDYETAGPTYLTGAWAGDNAAYEGEELSDAIPTDLARRRAE